MNAPLEEPLYSGKEVVSKIIRMGVGVSKAQAKIGPVLCSTY
jgi:hypothetical protein